MPPQFQQPYSVLPPVLVWTSPEYERVKRGADWYWSVWIITIALVVASIIFGEILFGVLILISVFSFTLFSKHTPRILKHTIDERGISSGNSLYPYGNLDSFWLEETTPRKGKLILKSQKKLSPLIVMLVHQEDIPTIRTYLSHFLPEEEHQEPIFHKLLDYLGF